MPLTGAVDSSSKVYNQTTELASRDLTIEDAFVMLYSNNGALVFTVDENIFAEGTQISLLDLDGGAPVFAAGAGVTINTSGILGPSAQFTIASIILSPTANVWTAVGNV